MHSESPVSIRFSGQGRDYFRIWIVNVLLSVLTLGIYSAWAKVRRMQYFYRHTSLAGDAFDYHGAPGVILRGRLIAVLMFLVYQLAARSSPLLALLVFLLLLLGMPWLVHRSLRFRLHNSSHRGLRFAFHGSVGRAYLVFLLYPFLALLSFGLAIPWWVRQMKVYQYGNSAFGKKGFECTLSVERVYGIYALAAIISVGSMVLLALMGGLNLLAIGGAEGADSGAVGAGGTLWVMAGYGLLYFGVTPFVQAHLQNAVWSSVSIDGHRFESTLSGRRLAWISASNLAATLLTLGLFRPFAEVRMMRYRLERIALLPAGNLDAFIQDAEAGPGAFGEEAAEIFDFDLAL